MGSRSYGSASQAARLAGADFDQQRLAGAGAAAITLGTNQLTNLSKPFQKIYGKGLAETIAGRLAGRFGASTAMQMLIRFSNTADGRVFLSTLGEMGEENLEGWLQAAWERFVYNPEAEYTAEEARRDRAVAGALGLIGGGFDVATDWRWDKNGQIQVGTDVETGARTPAVIDAFLEGFLDGDVESMRTKPDAAIERTYQGELPALPQGDTLAALSDGRGLALEGIGGLQGTGGLPGAVDFRKLYEVALQNGVALPEIAREWYVEQQMSALRQEFFRRVYGVEPIVPRLPEWSGGGLEGSADAGDGALVPMLRDAEKASLEVEDQREFAEFQAVLGDDAPKSLAEFLDLKYNQPDKWDYTKRFAGYMKKYPNSGKAYFDVQETLRIQGIHKGIALPPIPKKAFILPDGKYDPYHIMHRMMERQITDDQIREYIKDAQIMFVQWNGQRQRFVGANGTCVITKSKDGWIFKTAWKKSDNDEEADKIMEAIRNAGL